MSRGCLPVWDRVLSLCGVVLLFVTLPARAQEPAAKEFRELLRVTGDFPARDPKAKGEPVSRFHKLKLSANSRYVIDVVCLRGPFGRDTNPRVLVRGSKGQQSLAGGSEGPHDARREFHPPATDTYRLTVFPAIPNMSGKYLLVVYAAPFNEYLPTPDELYPVASEAGDIIVTPLLVSSLSSSRVPVHGYLEFAFLAENRSTTDKHQVTLTIPRAPSSARVGYGNHFLRMVRRTVVLEPGGQARVSLLVPDVPLSGNNEVGLIVDGVAQPVPVGLAPRVERFSEMHMKNAGNVSTKYRILTSYELAGKLQQNVYKMAIGKPRVQQPNVQMARHWDGKQELLYPDIFDFQRSAQPVAKWSSEWLSYSSYDNIVVRAAEFTADKKVQAALCQFVDCGGSLLIVGAAKPLESWRHEVKRDGVTTYASGFGTCMVIEETNVAEWQPQQWQAISAMWERQVNPAQQARAPTQANTAFPIIEDSSIPVRNLFLLMLVFVVLIGPVNVYVLARKKRRIWLLWTVPVFSSVTCVLLFGYMLASEGWYGYVRTEGLTILDEAAGRATTIGWYGCYSPVTPADGLRFSAGTELTPHLIQRDNYYSRRRGQQRSLEWTDDEQHLQSGWVTARMPAHFVIRKSEMCSERVIFAKGAGGTLTATSKLNTDIQTLWYAERGTGKLYKTGPISAGGTATLTAQAEPDRVQGGPEKLWGLYAQPWDQVAGHIAAAPEEYLSPGCYVAVLDGAPFIETALRNAQHRKSRSVVYGFPKEPL